MDNSVSYMGVRERNGRVNSNKDKTSFRERDISPPSMVSSTVSHSKTSSRKTSHSSNDYYASRIPNGRKSRSEN